MVGVKSTALRFGENTRTWLTGFSVATITGLGLTGICAGQTWPYYLGVTAAAAHLGWQLKTVNFNNREDCWNKFSSNQWIGRFILAGIITGTLLQSSPNSENELTERLDE